jgi:hypothetical protein
MKHPADESRTLCDVRLYVMPPRDEFIFLPYGDRNTLINVTAMTDLPPPFFTVCFPHLFTQELSNQSGDLQGFFDRSEMAGLINNFELRTGNL